MPPPIWKKPMGVSSVAASYQAASSIMYSIPVRTVCTLRMSPAMQWPAKMLPVVESSQPGTKMGRFFSQAASIHEFLGSI